MKFYVAIVLTLCSLPPTAIGKEKPDVKDWEWHGAKESGAWLHTEKRGSKVKFNLELSRGAPSYNSGVMSGEFIVSHGLGTYKPTEFPGCTLTFAFVGRTVKVEQSGADFDCGFGYGVMASHLLTLKDKSK